MPLAYHLLRGEVVRIAAEVGRRYGHPVAAGRSSRQTLTPRPDCHYRKPGDAPIECAPNEGKEIEVSKRKEKICPLLVCLIFL